MTRKHWFFIGGIALGYFFAGTFANYPGFAQAAGLGANIGGRL